MRALAVMGCFVWMVSGCDRAPSSEGLPEWTARDHDRLAEEGRTQQPPPAPPPPPRAPTGDAGVRTDAGPSSAAAPGGNPSPSAGGLSTAELAELTWKNQCVLCHGPAGRGDGPQGPMMHPPDFSVGAWQKSRSDAELATAIREGKGKMPKFGLSEPVIQGLVTKVRSLAGP